MRKNFKPPSYNDWYKKEMKKIYQDPFKLPKEEPPPHVMTAYERELINDLTPIIQSKRLIKFWYEDETTDFRDWRIVEPHLIGQVKYKTRNIWLSAWFLPSQEQVWFGHIPDWKNYILDNMKQIQILPENFNRTRPNYNPEDKRMIRIFCATSPRVI